MPHCLLLQEISEIDACIVVAFTYKKASAPF